MATINQKILMCLLRGQGLQIREIGERVGLSKSAVAYNLKKIRQQTLADGLDQTIAEFEEALTLKIEAKITEGQAKTRKARQINSMIKQSEAATRSLRNYLLGSFDE